MRMAVRVEIVLAGQLDADGHDIMISLRSGLQSRAESERRVNLEKS